MYSMKTFTKQDSDTPVKDTSDRKNLLQPYPLPGTSQRG